VVYFSININTSFSILSIHDSIEMYLRLLAENLNINSDKFKFMEYWDTIPTLSYKESMRSLNAIRVSIKHKGILPSMSDIEICRVNATSFFKENTKQHFGIEFNDISLFSLVKYVDVKYYLEKSQVGLDGNNMEECIENVAIAFDILTSTYENTKTNIYQNSPFYFENELRLLSLISINEWQDKVGRQKLSEFANKVKNSFERIQKSVKIMSFGIDYKKFVKFKLLTPTVSKRPDGRYITHVSERKKWTKMNCQYCIDFVLESTLKLQEFEFDLEELIEM